MIINHNMNALNSHRMMTGNTAAAGKSMEKLSSGLRINRAGDDAAGLAISEKMRGQIRGLEQASRNSQDSISMVQTAEGALNETQSILQRMRELAVQAGNDTNTKTDRGEIQKEINQLSSEINRIGNTTEFNNQKILNATGGDVQPATTATAGATNGMTIVADKPLIIDGITVTAGSDYAATKLAIEGDATLNAKYTVSGSDMTDIVLTQNAGFESATAPVVKSNGVDVAVTMGTNGVEAAAAKSSFKSQVGANENQTMTLDFGDMRADALGITATAGDAGFTAVDVVTDGTNNTAAEAALDVSTAENAGKAITKIQDAINSVSGERSKLGAYQNRLEHTINNLNNGAENLTAAESRIRDVDMAKEMLKFSKNNILQQASQAMLAQAKQQPQGVLQLLR